MIFCLLFPVAEQFEDLSACTSLQLTNNEISWIDDEAFEGLDGLVELGLRSNKLTVISVIHTS